MLLARLDMGNPGYRFENELKQALEDEFKEAYVFRFKQNRFTEQDFDLAVIRTNDPLLIECKSRDVRDRVTWTLDTLFDEGQLDRQLDIIERTGLTGLLAFEMRRGRGKAKRAIFINHGNIKDQIVNFTSDGVLIPRVEGEYKVDILRDQDF